MYYLLFAGSDDLLAPPVYSDSSGIPELQGEWYGAMGEHSVRKFSMASPWPAYANDEKYNVDVYAPADMVGKRQQFFLLQGGTHLTLKSIIVCCILLQVRAIIVFL